jgi:hypothetical protein
MKIGRNDRALLDKQLWGVDPHPPSLIGLGFAAVFLGGVIIGSVLFAREHKQVRLIGPDVTGSISSQKAHVPLPGLKAERAGKAD